jgi:branched-chain amino acid transport system substrate-binding protein
VIADASGILTNMNRMTFSSRVSLPAKSLLAAVLLCGTAGLASANDLVVMHIAPYSGPDGTIGTEYGDGARLYFERVNAQGGVLGSRVVLVARDDASDPQRTSIQAMSAGRMQPVAFIGTVGTDNVNSLLPALEKLDVPLLGPVVDAAGVSATSHPYVFHVRPDVRQEVTGLAGELYALGMRRIVLCASGPAALADVGVHADAPASVSTVSIVRCEGDAGQIASTARAIAASDVQAVIYAGPAAEAAVFVAALRAANSFAMVVTTSAVDPRALTRALPRAARSWLAVAESVPNPRLGVHAAAAPVVREFLAMRETSHSAIPASRDSLAGFMAAKLAVEAMRRAGPNPSAANVRAALDDMREFDMGGIKVGFQRRESGPSYVRLGILGSNGVILN